VPPLGVTPLEFQRDLWHLWGRHAYVKVLPESHGLTFGRTGQSVVYGGDDDDGGNSDSGGC